MSRKSVCETCGFRHYGNIPHAAVVEHDANGPFVRAKKVRTVVEVVDAREDMTAMAVLRAILRPYAEFKRTLGGTDEERRAGDDAMERHIEALDWAYLVVPLEDEKP